MTDNIHCKRKKTLKFARRPGRIPAGPWGFVGCFSQKVLMGMSGSSPVFSTFWITTS